jgi:hypothetical protein
MPRTVDLEGMSRVQRLVHLAVRHDAVTTEAIRSELFTARQRSYNDEIAIQTRRAGCTGGGDLRDKGILRELNQASKDDAKSISNTYNADLAAAIRSIAADNPRANRNVYVARLRDWEADRAQTKAVSIAQYTESTARAAAFSDFVKLNSIEGTAVLQPEEAVCPVCEGLVSRGEIPIREASLSPPPFHQNCPHYYVTLPVKIPKEDCESVWRG